MANPTGLNFDPQCASADPEWLARPVRTSVCAGYRIARICDIIHSDFSKYPTSHSGISCRAQPKRFTLDLILTVGVRAWSR